MKFKKMLYATTKKALLFVMGTFMCLQIAPVIPTLAEATAKTSTFKSEISDNLFHVDGYGDLIIGAIKNADGTVAWCLNKQKPFPTADGILYQNQPNETNWTWEIEPGKNVNADQVKKVKNVIYGNNYEFRKRLANYGLGENDTMSLYHASSIAQWAIVEGWTPDMVKKSDGTLANPTLDALATSIHSLFTDIYNYAQDTNLKTYISGATLYNYEDPTNLITIGDHIQLSDAKKVQEVATGDKYFRSEKMYLVPNQNNGYVFDGEEAYTYDVKIGAGAPLGTRIVNEYGVQQTTFSTRLTPTTIGTNFFVEVPVNGISAGQFEVVVETTKFIRENPMIYTPLNEPQYQSLIQYYGASDHAKKTLTVQYPDGENLVSYAQLNILKEANQMTGFKKAITGHGDLYQPTFQVKPLAGTSFVISYKDDIANATNGKSYTAGQTLFANPVKTSKEGYIKIGKIAMDADNPTTTLIIEEVSPTTGFTLGKNTIQEVVISKATGTVISEVSFKNDPMLLEFNATKVLVDSDNNEINGANALFGYYVNEEMKGIPAGSLVAQVSTDATGKIDNITSKLPVGYTYTIKELKAPAGYIKSDTVYTVDGTLNDVNKNQDKIVAQVTDADGAPVTKIKNVLKSFAEVKVTKTDSKDITKPLEGATFGLFKKGSTQAIEEQVSNSKGEAIFKSKLPFGDYLVKELVAPKDYVLSKIEKNFTIDSEDQTLISISFTNEMKMVAIEVSKTDSVSKLLMADVEFKIYKNEDTDLKTPLATVKTDSKGIAKFENLDYVDYRIVETSLPTGYIGKLVNQSVLLTDKPLQDVTKIDVENTPFLANVKAVKVDANDTTKRLIGAVYELYKVGNDTTPLSSATSDSKGEMSFTVQVPFGDYYIKEKTAPAGYQLSEEKIGFTINSTTQTEVTLTAKDAKRFVNIRIEKIDNDNQKVFLAGAEFKLYETTDSALKYPIKTVTTGTDGKISIQGLPIGKYWLIETKSPAGYALDGKKIVLDLEKLAQNETLVITVRNVKKAENNKPTEKPKEPTVKVEKPNTGVIGEGNSGLLLISGLGLLGVAAYILVKNKKKEESHK